MEVKTYIQWGRTLKAAGKQTDGCSFVGWLLNDKYEPACWAHDFGRQDLILGLADQSANDNLFRSALRYLGMSKWKSNLMYYFTKTQGWFAEHVNMGANAFVGFLFFLTFVGVSFYFGVIK